MKKQFVKPQMEICRFEQEDIMATSTAAQKIAESWDPGLPTETFTAASAFKMD